MNINKNLLINISDTREDDEDFLSTNLSFNKVSRHVTLLAHPAAVEIYDFQLGILIEPKTN